jgi:hypothetical protein
MKIFMLLGLAGACLGWILAHPPICAPGDPGIYIGSVVHMGGCPNGHH